jgi:hypothetical protein
MSQADPLAARCSVKGCREQPLFILLGRCDCSIGFSTVADDDCSIGFSTVADDYHIFSYKFYKLKFQDENY